MSHTYFYVTFYKRILTSIHLPASVSIYASFGLVTMMPLVHADKKRLLEQLYSICRIKILPVQRQVKCSIAFLILKNVFHVRKLFILIAFLMLLFSHFPVLSFQLKILAFHWCFNYKCLVRILRIISRLANLQEEILVVFSRGWQDVCNYKNGGNKINKMVKSIEGQLAFYRKRCNFI